MFKSILDSRYGQEYETLRTYRTQIEEIIALDIARNRPSDIASRWVKITRGPLQDNSHPLLGNKITPSVGYPLPLNVDYSMLQVETKEIVHQYVTECIEHIQARNAIKRLIAELENTTHKEAVLAGWPRGLETVEFRTREEIIADLEEALK